MSVLVHLCRQCDHQELWHSTRNGGYTSCPCCRSGTCDTDPETVLLQTFSLPGWRPEPLIAPGTTRNAGSMHASVCCGCGACVAAYRRLTAVAASA